MSTPSPAWSNPTWQQQSEWTRRAFDSMNKKLSAANLGLVTMLSDSLMVATSAYIDAWASGAADFSVAALPLDWIQVSASCTWTNNATVVAFLDMQIVTSGSYISTGTTIASPEGVSAWHGNTNAEAAYGRSVGGPFFYQAQTADIGADGKITFRPRIASIAASRGIQGNVDHHAQFAALNVGRGA